MAEFAEAPVRAALSAMMRPDALLHLCHPIGTLRGPEMLYEKALAPLFAAWPDLERREWLAVTGQTKEGENWTGCAGHYMGSFFHSLFDIPPTGQPSTMRFAEFFRHEGDRVVEMQAIWDFPEVMMHAKAWPLAPSLGREMTVPGPMTCDGLGPHDLTLTKTSQDTVLAMLTAMGRHPREPVSAMELPRFWHPQMNWYGPAGIGTARGIEGFRLRHQIPFIAAMPDRGLHPALTRIHFFAEGAYAAVTGWPNMAQTLTGGGWLGLPPTDKKITLRSLDFWRLEGGRIRENWVLIDLLDIFRQIGVDVFARMRALCAGRLGASILSTPDDVSAERSALA